MIGKVSARIPNSKAFSTVGVILTRQATVDGLSQRGFSAYGARNETRRS